MHILSRSYYSSYLLSILFEGHIPSRFRNPMSILVRYCLSRWSSLLAHRFMKDEEEEEEWLTRQTEGEEGINTCRL